MVDFVLSSHVFFSVGTNFIIIVEESDRYPEPYTLYLFVLCKLISFICGSFLSIIS